MTIAEMVERLRPHLPPEITERYLQRLDEGAITREENPESHFCVYFAAFDPAAGTVFIGDHIKGGQWLFNGGHIDRDEQPEQTRRREITEEWGISPDSLALPPEPNWLSMTPIVKPARPIPCKIHFDIWYFIPVDQTKFQPDAALLATEFHENRWITYAAAPTLVTDANTLQAIELMSRR